MRNSLKALAGIHWVEVDYDREEAAVSYSPDLVKSDAMIEATAGIGFPSSVKPSTEQAAPLTTND